MRQMRANPICNAAVLQFDRVQSYISLSLESFYDSPQVEKVQFEAAHKNCFSCKRFFLFLA